MNDNEDNVLRITEQDIVDANQLSLACPICAGPVENSPAERQLAPVVCDDCGTLYHHACWHQNGGKCAILGCTSTESHPFGVVTDVLRITMRDVPSDAQVSRENKRLKRVERERLQGAAPQASDTPGFWGQLFNNILRAFGVQRSANQRR